MPPPRPTAWCGPPTPDGRLTYLRTQLVVNRESRDVEFGRLLVERRGSQATVVAVGPMLDRTLDATAGMDVTVLYATTLAPSTPRP